MCENRSKWSVRAAWRLVDDMEEKWVRKGVHALRRLAAAIRAERGGTQALR